MNADAYWLKNYDRMTKEQLMQQLDAILDSSFDGLWICDGEGRVIRINRASEKINGIEANQVLGKRMEDLVKEKLIDCSVTLEVLKSRAARTMVQNLRNGKQILVTGNPLFNELGEITMVVTNDRDITQLNRLRADLDEARALNREYLQRLTNLTEKKELLSEMVIRSEEMYRVLNTAMKAAQFDCSILIQGESGVGKGLLARLIHHSSPRKASPFIRVDCAAIPESLVESELFGYERGAFTGASQKGKLGQLELGEGGTLFLDEIGSIPLNTQVKLLRFLEENEFVPVGGTKPKRVNARVIAASNSDLISLKEKGSFRADLFFRLNVVPLRIPPLRERREDIPALVGFYLKKIEANRGIKKTVSPSAVDAICAYPFPGNIRELFNLIEQLIVLSPHESIELVDLPKHIRESPLPGVPWDEKDSWNLKRALEAFEMQIITRSLNTFGSQRKAAFRLGINQSTLARKIKRYVSENDAISHHR